MKHLDCYSQILPTLVKTPEPSSSSLNVMSHVKIMLIESEAQRLLQHFGLWQQGWRFCFDHAQRRAGMCSTSDRMISIAKAFVLKMPPSEITETLLHEIAHALVGSEHGHDAVWKAKAIAIGANGQACHNFEFAQPPYLKKCMNGCWQEPAYRRNHKIHRYRCIHCQGEIIYEKFEVSPFS